MILDKINSPADLKKLSVSELPTVAQEIREGLFNRLTKIGGHFGPNFGFVEATIALHYVFDSPKDKFVFDVSHQSYAHKMLTGRKAGYFDDSRFQKIQATPTLTKASTTFSTSGTLQLQSRWLWVLRKAATFWAKKKTSSRLSATARFQAERPWKPSAWPAAN